jgi:hypothetical protein
VAWLRLDDTFDTHAKILGLGTDGRRWTWQRILLYACRHRSAIIPAGIRDVVAKATPSFLEDCTKLGLIDVDSDGTMKVHDWRIYNSETVAEKVAAFIAQKPDATANQVHKAIGGKREVVLAVFAQMTAAGTQTVPAQYPSGSQEVPNQYTPPVPLAGAREPVPDPSLETTPSVLPSNVDLHENGRKEGDFRKTEAEQADQDRDHLGVPLDHVFEDIPF